MITTLLIHAMLIFNILISCNFQEEEFNIKNLGKGTIHLKDDRTLVKIELIKIEQSWITYIKNKTLHDLAFEKINYLEFPDAKEGKTEIRFEDGKKHIKIIHL